MDIVVCLIFIILAISLLLIISKNNADEKQSQVEEPMNIFNDKTPYEVFLETYRGKLVNFFGRGDYDTFHRWVRQHKESLIQLVGVENYNTKTIAISILSALKNQGLTHLVHNEIEDEDNVVLLLFIGTQEEFEHYKENQENNRLELNKKLGTIV